MKSYLDIIKTVLEEGSRTPQRAKVHGQPVDMLVLPGMTFRHNIWTQGFPLLTTKRVPLHMVAAELEFFIKGEHRKEDLHRRNCTIWDEWQAPGQNDPNELGPIYGVQWRGWSKYDFEGEAFIERDPPMKLYAYNELDQMQALLDKLRTDPYDRRTVVTAWNPAEIHKMALPACHMIWQTVVTKDINGAHVLNLCMTMRSADLMLGVPFNIASYALLTLLLAKHVGMHPGTLHVTMNNAHIYENHIEAAKIQLARNPHILPWVEIPDREDGKPFNIFEWDYRQVKVQDYNPQASIKMDVAV